MQHPNRCPRWSCVPLGVVPAAVGARLGPLGSRRCDAHGDRAPRPSTGRSGEASGASMPLTPLPCAVSECLAPAKWVVTFKPNRVYHYCARHYVGIRRNGWRADGPSVVWTEVAAHYLDLCANHFPGLTERRW